MISYDIQTIGYVNTFEKISRANVKDCFVEGDTIWFVVQSGQLWKAIGKSGANVKKMASMIKKQIKVIEFNDDVTKFIANLIYPIKAEDIKENEGKVVIKTSNSVEKGKIFGRDRSNLKKLQEIVSKYFKVELVIA